jgi:hypothetical protein
MAASKRPRPKLLVPEPIEITIDHVKSPVWSKPAVRESTWRDAVGVRIAERAQPVELSRGTLWVRVATSVWANELSLLSEQLMSRLRERGVPVERLRFKVGAIDLHGGPPEVRRRRAALPSPRLPGEVEDRLADVCDDELRERIADAARANLAWQENLAIPKPPRGN